MGLKKIIGLLPHSTRQELRRLQCWWQIRTGHFRSPELEYRCLEQLVNRGDWVVDIGANVGHYTCRLSELVGPEGRVIAFEPVPATFEVLAANSRHFRYQNVTLINAAISDHSASCGMVVPDWTYGGPNYYQAHLKAGSGNFQVLCWPLDSFLLPSHRIALLKIDAEETTQAALRGAFSLIQRDHPLLIVEGKPEWLLPDFMSQGYRAWGYPDSANVIFSVIPPRVAGMIPLPGSEENVSVQTSASL